MKRIYFKISTLLIVAFLIVGSVFALASCNKKEIDLGINYLKNNNYAVVSPTKKTTNYINMARTSMLLKASVQSMA